MKIITTTVIMTMVKKINRQITRDIPMQHIWFNEGKPPEDWTSHNEVVYIDGSADKHSTEAGWGVVLVQNQKYGGEILGPVVVDQASAFYIGAHETTNNTVSCESVAISVPPTSNQNTKSKHT